MDQPEPTKRPLGHHLVGLCDRELITTGQACLMFINQVALDAMVAEFEASPPAFQHALKEYVGVLGIGTPEWEECFLIGGIYNFGDRSAEEVEALYRGIAKKNRLTAEALWHYLERREASPAEAEPVAAPDPAM